MGGLTGGGIWCPLGGGGREHCLSGSGPLGVLGRGSGSARSFRTLPEVGWVRTVAVAAAGWERAILLALGEMVISGAFVASGRELAVGLRVPVRLAALAL